MRKCQNPFNEGWKIATFKPIDERLIPYRAVVKKWIPQSKYGFLDWDGQEVFVHKSQVMDNDLQVGEHVLFEVNTLGKHQLEAKNVSRRGARGCGADVQPGEKVQRGGRDS